MYLRTVHYYSINKIQKKSIESNVFVEEREKKKKKKVRWPERIKIWDLGAPFRTAYSTTSLILTL